MGRRNWNFARLGLKRTQIRERTQRKILKIEAHTKQDGICPYCTEYMPLSQSTAEHKKPVSRGGRTEAKNIDAACERCNKLKGSMTKAEFNTVIHNRNLSRDGWELYLIGLDIRLQRRTELACKRLRHMVGMR